MSLEEAALFRKRFFETYPGLKRWHEHDRRTGTLIRYATRGASRIARKDYRGADFALVSISVGRV
jgi:hypothetical protein